MDLCSEEAMKYVWEGAIPLQIHLHESEITTLPHPPPIMVLGPRLGYLPLLIPLIKPHFNSTLPPGADSVWFDYKGLPLKWYIPTGVLFDLLCAEPERPWNLTSFLRCKESITQKIDFSHNFDHASRVMLLTVHFRGHPAEVLTPCEGEDSVKWSFINSLKEAAYIINGNCKNIMNMSQADQFELWQSLVKGDMDGYLRVSSKLKLGPLGQDCLVRMPSSTGQSRQTTTETDSVGPNRSCRIPVRLYLRCVGEDIEDIEDACAIDSWDKISYINRPVEIHKEEGCTITLASAVRSLLPEIFEHEHAINDHTYVKEGDEGAFLRSEDEGSAIVRKTHDDGQHDATDRIKLIRIQGIELDPQIPLCWVVNNLKHPEYFLHACVFVGTASFRTRA